MKAWMIPLIGVAILALSLGATATACDGGGSEELTLEEYFQELDKLTTEFDERGREAEQDFEDTFDALESEEEMIGATIDFLSAGGPIVKDFVDGLDALDPPAEAKEAHERAVEEGRTVVKSFEDTLAKAEGVDDPAELEQILADSSIVGSGDDAEDFADNCAELQAIADENKVQVDLMCEGEAGSE